MNSRYFLALARRLKSQPEEVAWRTGAAVEPTRSQITAEMARYERDVLRDVTYAP